jgi:hypothetical protein
VILATHGKSAFFEEEAAVLRDVRRAPLKIGGYSIGYRAGRDGKEHVSVRIEQKLFEVVKSRFLHLASSESVESLGAEFASLRFEPFAPVRNQLFMVLRAVNRKRKAAGLPLCR